MADKKISELTALSSANLQDIDLLPIVDSDTTNSDSSPANTSKQTKSLTIGDLKTSIFSNPALTGYVGIGTSNPQAPLHIDVTNIGSGQPRGIIIQRDANVDGTVMGTISFNNGENMNSPDINNSPRFDETIARIRTTLQSNSDSNSPNPDAGGSMALQTKDEEGSLETRIEIRETGNVGIGTSTPDSLLHLDGGNNSVEMILETYGAGGCKISFADDDDNDVGQISYNHLDNSLTIKTNATDAITIDSSQDTTFAGSVTTNDTVTIGNGTGGGNNLTFNSLANSAHNIDFQEAGTSALKIIHAPAESANKLKFLFDNDSANYPHGQLQITNAGGINILAGGGISVNTGSISSTYGSISTTSGGFYSNGTGGGPSGTGSFNLPEAAGAQFWKKRPGGGATDYDHAILNNESDTVPINVIRRMSQSDYNGITPDANTLYIIT